MFTPQDEEMQNPGNPHFLLQPPQRAVLRSRHQARTSPKLPEPHHHKYCWIWRLIPSSFPASHGQTLSRARESHYQVIVSSRLLKF